MPAHPRLGRCAALFLALAACATPTPRDTAPAAPPAPAPPAAAEAPLPPLALAPRARWTRIRIDPRSGIREAWLASDPTPLPGGHLRRWVVGNLREPIPLPETGGHAASVAFLADYHCDKHAWEPVETIWFTRRDAQQEALRERPRGRGEREVAHGTLVDVFLDAACAPRASRSGQPARR